MATKGDKTMKNKAMLVSIITTAITVIGIAIAALVNEIRLNPDVTLFGGLLFLLSGVEVVGGAVLLIVLSTKIDDNKLDERQLRARGQVAIYTLLGTVIVALGIALISQMSTFFPITTYDCCMIIAFTALYTFLISADINDAFISYKENRKSLTIIYLAVGVICLLLSGVFPIRIPDFIDEFKVATFVIGILALTLGIEMIIKGNLEKKEALADEES